MTLPIANITKSGTYNSTVNIAFSGEKMLFSENLGLSEIKYFGTAYVCINILKGAQSFPRVGKPWETGQRSSGAVHLGNGYYDTTGGETWNPLVYGQSLDNWFPQGLWVLRWVGSCTARWTAEDQSWGSETDAQTNSLIAGQTHSDYDGTGANGSFAGGTGHAVNDIITFVSGATATVDAVSSGIVTQFTIDKTGDYNNDHGGGPATGDDGTQVAATADNQFSSTGSGTGFNLTPGVNNIIHRITYTTTTTDADAGLTVNTTNGTCTRLELLQPGNETRYNQGSIVASQIVTDLANVPNLRFMGLMATNSSPYRNYSEYPDYDDVTWFDGIPAKAIALFCNDCNADAWVNIPHMFTDAAVTSFLQEIYDHLDSGLSVWIENSNEVWNSAPSFKEQFSWISRGDVASKDATINLSTGTLTFASPHGFNDNDELRFFFTEEYLGENFSPYTAAGQTKFCKVDSTTVLRICNTTAAVGRGNSVTVTGDADYDANTDTSKSTLANMTKMRVKNENTSTKSNEVNNAERSVELWDIADSIFGRSRVKHLISGQRTQPQKHTDFRSVADLRDKVDYMGCACYFRFADLAGADRSMPLLTVVVNSQDETNYDDTNYVTDAQDETDYDADPEVEGVIEAGGTGYVATDTITITGGTVITVDAVSSGAVTEFTVDSSADTGGHSPNDILSQTSTSGTGTGFQLRVRQWNITYNGTWDGGTGHAVSDVIRLGHTFTADLSNNRLSGLSGYIGPWTRIQLESTGTLPAPLQEGTYYWVVDRNTSLDYIQLSEDGPYDDPVTLTDAGTGQHRAKGYIDVTVDAVSGGVVTQFTVDSSNDEGRHKLGDAIEQISTTGAGTGFTLTPEASNVASTATLTDVYNYLVDDNQISIIDQQQNNINAMGRDILYNYEGFDHQGSTTWSYTVPSIGQLIELWGRSTERTTFITQFIRRLANKNIKMCCHHSFITDYDHSGVWGRMEHQSDSDAAEHVAMLPYLEDGAPKI